MRIAVAIATTGRPEVVAQMLQRLGRQSRPPDRLLVIGAAATDFPAAMPPGVETAVSARGLTRQRNRALDLLDGDCEAIVFFDDDFVPAAGFLAGAERLLHDHPGVVAASGRLLADGFASSGLQFAEADALIAAHEAAPPGAPRVVAQRGAYGCNMVIRRAAVPLARFDEALPLYGWLEDLDFTAPLARVGAIVWTDLCVGVHLGLKSGRVPGLQLGYSQVANPAYLVRKGTMGACHATVMAARNVLANAARSMRPEPYIDRRGRLRGNLLAALDLIAGRSHPERVLSLARGRPGPGPAPSS